MQHFCNWILLFSLQRYENETLVFSSQMENVFLSLLEIAGRKLIKTSEEEMEEKLFCLT